VPELLPWLTNYLAYPPLAYNAAIALGRIGPKAAPAIPALIQVVDQGVAGEYTNADAARFYWGRAFSNPLGWHMARMKQDEKGMNHNRAMAALALGRIGLPSPAVCAALARGWNAPDPWVRHNAALAVELLAPSMTNELPQLLNGLRETNNSALGSKILAIGKIGPPAHDALAALRELSKPSRLQTLLDEPKSQIVGDNVEDLSIAAKMAICRIAPEEGRPFLPDIASRIGFWWDPVLFLTESGPWSNDVVRVVEPLLEEHADGQRGTVRQSLAAYVILSHDRQHARALAALRQNKSTGNLNDRLLAGRLMFEAVGETNGLCELLNEGFKSPDSFIGIWPTPTFSAK
jgi:hypothetical protein